MSHHCCPPRSALAGIWRQEPEPELVVNPDTLIKTKHISTGKLNPYPGNYF